jgi:hypothetical protein
VVSLGGGAATQGAGELVRKVVLLGGVAIGALLFLGNDVVMAQEPAPAAPSTELLPLSVNVDSDTPLEGATIRVVDDEGQPLEQTDGADRGRTNDNGVAVLEFDALPSRFAVVIDGGRTSGTGFDGTLRDEVAGYDPTTDGVVVVSPVSTIAAATGVSDSEAKALLGIPGWFDDSDFLHDNTYFDAGTFLRAADREGGVDALIRHLVDQQRADPATRVRFRARGGAAAAGAHAAADQSWLSLAAKAKDGDYKPLVGQLFSTLASTAASKLGGAAGEAILGWTLQAVGLGSLVEDSGKRETLAALKALGESIARLQSQVAGLEKDVNKGSYTNLVAQAGLVTSKIDTAQDMLENLAKLKAENSTATNYRNMILTYIGANLTDAGSTLNGLLASNVPVAGNLIKFASKSAAADSTFFDTQTSKLVASVAAYYALYQARLAVLITEYQHANPQTFAPEVTQADIARLKANVGGQAAVLRPAVPAGAVIDRRTNLMWTQNAKPNPMPASDLFKRVFSRPDGTGPLRTVYPQATNGPRSIARLPGEDWVLPGKSDIERLIDGRGSEAPADYLANFARMSYEQLHAGGRLAFMSGRDGWVPKLGAAKTTRQPIFPHSLTINRFDLKQAKVQPTTVTWCSKDTSACVRELDGQLAKISGAVMYVRPVARGESYWWS